tara:strand:+ start:87542 stop:88102 length:561 start_codon:yes stop_codon:yes gene_type:complete
MAVDLRDILNVGEEIGIFDVALPFILVFVLAFGVLQKSKLLGKESKNLNVIVSLVIGLLFIRNQYLVGVINQFLPNISLFMIIILMFILLVGIFVGKEHEGWTGNVLGVAFFVSIIFIIWSLSATKIGELFSLPSFLTDIDQQTKGIILFIAVFVIIIWLVTKEPKDKSKVGGSLEKLANELRGGK